MKNYLTLALPLLLLYSCGPSDEEQRAKEEADSIAAYTLAVTRFEATIDSTVSNLFEESQIDSVRSYDSYDSYDSMTATDSTSVGETKSLSPGMSHKVKWRVRGMNDFKVVALMLEGKKMSSDKWIDGEDDLQLDDDLDVVAQLKAQAGSVWFMAATVNGNLIKFMGKPIIWDTVPASGIQDINVKCTW